MLKTPLSTVLGGAFWTPGTTIIAATFEQRMKKLFANGEQGFWYDPNDLSTMYQDAAGTVPVTGVGQPVGLIRDKSGRNNHAYQTTSASRPILRKNAVTGANYLEFDGTDDFLQTNNINFAGTDKVGLFAGVRALGSTTVPASVVELGTNPASGQGTFWLNCNALVAGDVWIAMAQSISFRTGFSKVLNQSEGIVFSAKLNFAGEFAESEIQPRVNGSSSGFTRGLSTSAGTGNFGNHPLYIGRRAGTGLAFNGPIYSLIGIGRLTIDSETSIIEKELAKRLGVTLNV